MATAFLFFGSPRLISIPTFDRLIDFSDRDLNPGAESALTFIPTPDLKGDIAVIIASPRSLAFSELVKVVIKNQRSSLQQLELSFCAI